MTNQLFVTIPMAVYGAIFGYLSLWGIFQLFKLLTKKEGMGFGDFKLMSALGAWLGVSTLPAILMIASVLGSVIGVGLILLRGQDRQQPIAFGPYLAVAGWCLLMYPDTINQFMPFDDYFRLFW